MKFRSWYFLAQKKARWLTVTGFALRFAFGILLRLLVETAGFLAAAPRRDGGVVPLRNGFLWGELSETFTDLGFCCCFFTLIGILELLVLLLVVVVEVFFSTDKSARTKFLNQSTWCWAFSSALACTNVPRLHVVHPSFEFQASHVCAIHSYLFERDAVLLVIWDQSLIAFEPSKTKP